MLNKGVVMRKIAVLLVALVGLSLPGSVQAADQPAPPTLIIRVNSLDSLVADFVYLAGLAGGNAENVAKQFDGLYKALKGPKGLQGIDPTKPLGAYGRLGPNLVDSELVLLVPVVDEATVLMALGNYNIKPEKKNDIYETPIPTTNETAYFRFADGYVYLTAREKKVLEKNNLLAPNKVLSVEQIGTASVSVLLEGVPADIKKTILGQAELRIADLKDQKQPGESEAQRKFRQALLDEGFAQLKSIINDGKDLTFRLDIDRKTNDATLSLSFTGKTGSKLAGQIADLARVPSLGAGLLAPRAAASWEIHLSLPENLRPTFGAAIDDIYKQVAQGAPADQKPLLEKFLSSITPTAKQGDLDAGASLIGPDAKGHYALVSGFKVKDGLGIERALKDIAKMLPAEAREKVQLKIDRDKIGTVNVHSFKPDQADPNAEKLLGDTTVYFAFREDAAFIATGDKALDALKTALAVTSKPGPVFQLDASVAQIIPLMQGANQQTAEAAAKKAFKEQGSDKVRISIEGGDSLKLKATARTAILQFLGEVVPAQKGQ
jgi:hypothetical protein